MRDHKIMAIQSIIILIAILTWVYAGYGIYHLLHCNHLSSPKAGGGNSSEAVQPPATFEDLLDAIEQVESGGDANAVGDNGNAIGSFQIWRIYVSDVNRISGKQFKFSDRYSREKSKEMVRIYLSHYGGTIEEMARKHNGGPAGYKKESTVAYWKKVKHELEK